MFDGICHHQVLRGAFRFIMPQGSCLGRKVEHMRHQALDCRWGVTQSLQPCLEALPLESRLLRVSLEQLARTWVITFFGKALKLAFETTFRSDSILQVSLNHVGYCVSGHNPP